MKVFEAPAFSKDKLTEYLASQARKEGVFKKKDLETLERIKILYRPFRRISWTIENAVGSEERITSSFIDEQLSPYIDDSDHRFLLWRPRYASLRMFEIEESDKEFIECENSDAIKQVVDDLILHRWNGQSLDNELRPKLRSIQADPLSAIALIIPRSPYTLRREETIIVERSEIHSFVLASSLIVNCGPNDIIIASEIRERVYAMTVIAVFQDVSSDERRYIVLETPGTNSLQDAKKSGAALTRICNLYPDFTKIIA